MSVPAPICMGCKRFDRASAFPLKCEAFPSGIPDEIIESEADHRKPFTGDQGLLFEPLDKGASDYAKQLFQGSAPKQDKDLPVEVEADA